VKKNFEAIYLTPTEKGQKTIIDIPFNVWEEFNMRGPVPINVHINGFHFKSKLSPKGNGFYILFFTNDMYKIVKPNDGDTLRIDIEPYEIEVRIPVDPMDARRIENISLVMEPINTACGQACIAMLANVSIDEVFNTMKTKGPTSGKMLIDALYHYKIRHHERFISYKNSPVLPELCIVDVKMPGYGHWIVYHKGVFYDPEFGQLSACHKDGRISHYLEIYST
jgi:hypothetical protein